MTSPTAGAGDHPQRNGADVPAMETFGVGPTIPGPGGVQVTVERRPDVVDAAGAIPTGVLGVAADHALGGAIAQVIGDDEVMITSHMHFEVVGAITSDVPALVAHGEVVEKGGGHAFTRGAVRTPDGRLLALMTARFALLPLTASAGGYVQAGPEGPGATAGGGPTTDAEDVSAGAPGPDRDASPVVRLLGLRVVEQTPDRVEAVLRAHGGLANERRGVHGGVGVLVGERVLGQLVAALDGAGRFRPVELRAVFLRPIPADGSEVACEARIGYAGRSVVTSRATLCTPGGKPAVVVDAIHAVGRP